MLDCLNESKSVGRDTVGRARIVQVIRGSDDLSVLVVSDKLHTITLMPTRECLDEFHKANPRKTLDSMGRAVIKLEKWHYSSLFLSAGSRSVKNLLSRGYTRPLVVQSAKISLMGAHDISVIGSPIDINADIEINKSVIAKMTHHRMMYLLQRQFPNEYSFPDAEGKFKIPRLYDSDYELRLDHCIIPYDQQQQMDTILAFDNVDNTSEASEGEEADEDDVDDDEDVDEDRDRYGADMDTVSNYTNDAINGNQDRAGNSANPVVPSESQHQAHTQSRGLQRPPSSSTSELPSSLCSEPMTQDHLERMDEFFTSATTGDVGFDAGTQVLVSSSNTGSSLTADCVNHGKSLNKRSRDVENLRNLKPGDTTITGFEKNKALLGPFKELSTSDMIKEIVVEYNRARRDGQRKLGHKALEYDLHGL